MERLFAASSRRDCSLASSQATSAVLLGAYSAVSPSRESSKVTVARRRPSML